MAKRIECEFPLPDTAVQHIQSFLVSKQAAQTSLLSKSWYRAWLTRPDLDFRSPDFRTTDEFWEFAKKTIQRHEQSKLKIESFKLYADFPLNLQSGPRGSDVADELIVRAMKMDPVAFTLEFESQTRCYELPQEVLASKTLIRLALKWCGVDRGTDGEVRCSKLKSLSLRRVYIEGDMFWGIISGCSSIEEMELSQCHCYIFGWRDYPTLSPYIDLKKQKFVSILYLINLCEFHKLRCLVLGKMDIKASFFENFSTNFPCLKDFIVNHCNIKDAIRICSPSLERITFTRRGGVLRAKFDLPNLLKFTFSGSRMPALSFEKSSREWESDISIVCSRRHPYSSWFVELRRFLTKLRLSRISLSLNFRCNVENGRHDSDAGNIRSFTKPAEVESLTMHEQSLVCSALLDSLFWSCRPKFIYHYWLPESCERWNENSYCLKILCEKLVGGVGENCYVPDLNVATLHHLVKVNVERFEENIAEWQPMPLATLLDASTIPENKQKIRFCLKWE